MMRTPERVENLPSPPYVIVKTEDLVESNNQISNNQINSKIPDNPFRINTKDCRAGSKKQDLRALAAIFVAWQVGVDVYMERMKKLSNRIAFIRDYVQN